MTDDVETQRQEIVSSMCRVLARLAASRDWMTIDQRFEVAECIRTIADHLDRGRQLAPSPTAWRPRQRLVRSHKTECGQPLYKLVF
jgi:hypothetical protein